VKKKYGNIEGPMRGEERGCVIVRSAPGQFTVGYRDARRDKHAMDFRQPKPARSGCMGSDGTGRSSECAVRQKRSMSMP
jgi:hypothetical protein